MSEHDVREGLHGAVSDEPPLSVDPDALMATAQRQVKRRRTLLSAGVATVVVVAAAVAVPIALGRGTPPVTVGEQPSVSSEPGYATWPPRDIEPVTYTADELRQRATEMRTHLTKRLGDVLPDASEIDVGPFGGEAEGAIVDGQDYLNAFATFTVDGTRYGIGVNVFAPGASTEGPGQVCATYCELVGERDGGEVVARSEDLGEGQIRSIYHFRVTGTQVFVAGYNYDPTSMTAPVYAPAIPVSDDQLTELAIDPALGL